MPDDLPDLPDLPDIPDEILVSDPSQFEALSSGVRMRIIDACRNPRSVREVADHLDMPVTRLYYHVNLLEEQGFIEVVHTRKSGARLEKVYRVTGLRISPGPELLANIDDPAAAARAMTAIVLEPARAETEQALERRFVTGEEQMVHVGRTVTRLTPDQAREIGSRIDEILESMVGLSESDDETARAYSFTFTLAPAGYE